MKHLSNICYIKSKKCKNDEKTLRSYVIWNNKGGVGKTTISYNLINLYASKNPNDIIITIDLCPQANLSTLLLGGEKSENYMLKSTKLDFKGDNENKSIFSYFMKVLKELTSDFNPICIDGYLINVNDYNKNIGKNIKLIPGSYYLPLLESELQIVSYKRNLTMSQNEVFKKIYTYLQCSIFNYWEKMNKNVCVFIDTNPSLSFFTQIGIVSANNLIIPILPDYFSYLGLKYALKLIYGPMNYPISFCKIMKENFINLPKLCVLINNNYKIDKNEFEKKVLKKIYKMYNSKAYENIFLIRKNKTIDEFKDCLISSLPQLTQNERDIINEGGIIDPDSRYSKSILDIIDKL